MIKRSHKQNCSLAFAADILAERWTLLIIRELLLKPSRYGELLHNLTGMGTNLLAARLKELTALQLIEKQQSCYQLTSIGQSLESAVLGLIRWGFQFSESLSAPDYLHRPEWDLLAMKSLFNPSKSVGIALCMEIDFSSTVAQKNADSINRAKSIQSAWVIIQDSKFLFQFNKPSLTVDIHWRGSLSKLSSEQPERQLFNSSESNALKTFISAFDSVE